MRTLKDQTADVDGLFDQLHAGEVLRIGYRYGNNPDSGLYLFERDPAKLEAYTRPAGNNPITFYAVPEDEM